MPSMLQIQQKAPMTLNVMKSLSFIPPTPATTGENVRVIGKIRKTVEQIGDRLHRDGLERSNGRETFKFTAAPTQSNYRRLAARVSRASSSRFQAAARQS